MNEAPVAPPPGGDRVEATDEPGCGQQPPPAHPLDAERLRRVPVRRGRVRRREHVRLLGREAPPELIEVRLDAAHLRREVVRDEKRRHRAARAYAGTCSVDGRAGPARPRDVRPILSWSNTTPAAAATAPPANAPR